MTRFPKTITSLSNDRVKMIRSLEMHKKRKKEGLFVVEGATNILTANAAGFNPSVLVYGVGGLETEIQKKIVRNALQAGAEVLEVSAKVLEKLSSKSNPQSMLAVYSQRWGNLSEIFPTSKNVYLVLEQVRDPGNLGTIIRTADAVGTACIFLVGHCCDPYSRECVRASMGSIFNMPLVAAETEDFLKWAEAFPGDMVASMLTAQQDFRDMRYNTPCLLLMGNESSGLTKKMSDISRKKVKIPMQGNLDSLNLAVATALMLYQIRGNSLKI